MSILLELEKAIGQFKEGEPVNEQLRAIQNDTNFYEFFSFSEEVNLRDDFELIAREDEIFSDDDIIREYFESPDKDIDSDEDVLGFVRARAEGLEWDGFTTALHHFEYLGLVISVETQHFGQGGYEFGSLAIFKSLDECLHYYEGQGYLVIGGDWLSNNSEKVLKMFKKYIFTAEDAELIADELSDSYFVYSDDEINVGREVQAFWDEENRKWLLRYNHFDASVDGEGMLFPTINQWPYEGEVAYKNELDRWEVVYGDFGSEEAVEFEELPDIDLAASLIAEKFVEHFVFNLEDEVAMIDALKVATDAHPVIRRSILETRARVANNIFKRLWLRGKLFIKAY